MRSLIAFGAAWCLVACMTPPPQLAPSQLHVARTQTEVVQAATRVLALNSFEITVSDANAGTVVAKRTRTPDNDSDITCSYQHGSAFSKLTQTTFTITLSAQKTSGESSVVINGHVHADFANIPETVLGRPAANETDCASAGTVEKAIADALR